MQNPTAAADLAQFAREAAGDVGVPDTVARIVEQARRALRSEHAGITIRHAGGRLTSTATDPLVRKLFELQLLLHEGPCIEAGTEQRIVRSTDIAADPRWPRWGPRAADLGVRAALSVQLYTPQRNLGALNVYSERPGHFDTDGAEIAEPFAAHAAAALAAAEQTDTLQIAVTTRTMIGRAQGLLMARYQITGEQAFALLQRQSQDGNEKLRAMAEQIVADHEAALGSNPLGPIQTARHAADQAGARAAELHRRRIELQARRRPSPADVAAAQRAFDAAKERAAAAGERVAERLMRSAMAPSRGIAATHAAIADLYHQLADIDPTNGSEHQQEAADHDAIACRHRGTNG
jgi:GAF domain-containing protein